MKNEKNDHYMIRLAVPGNEEAIAATYEELLTWEQEYGSTSNWALGIYPTIDVPRRVIPQQTMYVLEDETGKICASMNLNQDQAPEYEDIAWKYEAAPEEVFVIHTLCIPPSQKRKGFGKAMVDFAKEKAKEACCRVIRIDTFAHNEPAKALYTRNGFRIAGYGHMVLQGVIPEEQVYLEYCLQEEQEKKPMKKIGLIGGTGPESTIIYYSKLTSAVQQKTGSFPPLAIESLSVYEVLGFCAKGDYDGLAAYLLKGFENLTAAGCEFAALTGITPHIVFEKLQEGSPIPLVSMVDAAAKRAAEKGCKTVLLLGTYPTMTGSFVPEAFAKQGLAMATPSEEEMRQIEKIIEDELELGICKEESKEVMLRIIRRCAEENGIDAVLLGCTELPLLLRDGDLSIPFLDAMTIHIETLTDMILVG